MSIGNRNLNSPWSSSSISSFDPTKNLASLQPSPAPETQINKIELPSWLKTDNSQISELTDSYGKISSAFDPTGQVNARNNAAQFNLSAGGQAANNTAMEYANRASQQGSSALGAGVVKAQAMMPVYAQNAALKTDAADIAAKSHQEGVSLAAQIASTIGQLRASYLSTLTGYAQGQQSLALQKYQAEQGVKGQQGQLQLGYDQLAAQQQQAQAALKLQQQQEARLAAQQALATPRPIATYTMGNDGKVISGMDQYQQLQAWQANQARASQQLGGMF